MRQRKERGGGRNDGGVQDAREGEGEFPATIDTLTISQLK